MLTLDRSQFDVLEPERFSPSAVGLLGPPFYRLGARGIFRCVQTQPKPILTPGIFLGLRWLTGASLPFMATAEIGKESPIAAITEGLLEHEAIFLRPEPLAKPIVV